MGAGRDSLVPRNVWIAYPEIDSFVVVESTLNRRIDWTANDSYGA